MPHTKKTSKNQFERVSFRTPMEIRAAAEELERSATEKYNIRSIGNSIWVELGDSRTDYWAPMLHIELEPASGNKTFIKGNFGKNPIQWAVFTIIRLFSVFAISILAFNGIRKSQSAQDFGFEVYAGAAVFCLWLTLWAMAQYHRRNDVSRDELRTIAEKLAA